MSGAATVDLVRHLSRAQWCDIAYRLYRRSAVIIGRDDRLLHDGDVVFVVNHTAHHVPTPIQEVDYFHGVHCGYVIAQMCYEFDILAYDMINTSGCLAKAAGYIQRIFRAKRIQASLHARRLLPAHIIRYHLITHSIAMYLPR